LPDVKKSAYTVEDAALMPGFVTVPTLVISSGLISGYKALPGQLNPSLPESPKSGKLFSLFFKNTLKFGKSTPLI
jgi:hypothetical protein